MAGGKKCVCAIGGGGEPSGIRTKRCQNGPDTYFDKKVKNETCGCVVGGGWGTATVTNINGEEPVTRCGCPFVGTGKSLSL